MTSEQLALLATTIEKIRIDSLFDETGDPEALGPDAEQYYLLTLAALETAQRFAKLASFAQRRCIVTGER
jgi:hypothetical protein